MNAPTRDDLLSLVSQRFPKKDPLEIVLRWVQELTEVSDEGVTILDASFPESLDVELVFCSELSRGSHFA
jgi:hypothetical protein